MALTDVVLLGFGLVGHAAIWIGAINRLHGLALPRPLVRWTTLLLLLVLTTLPLGFAALLYIHDLPWLRPTDWGTLAILPRCYAWTSFGVGLLMTVRWLWRSRPQSGAKLCQCGTVERLRPGDRLAAHPVGNPLRRVIARFPGNQCLDLEVVEKTLVVPQLPAALDGLTIAHLTDLHFTGGISKSFFQEIVKLTNAMGPDLVAVTGDLVDKADCIDWIPETLGRLEAPHGVYAILGNHDLRVKRELPRLQQTLSQAGLVDLGRGHRHLDIAGMRVLMAGNELPWIRPTGDAHAFPSRQSGDAAVRVLLSHSPDQFPWARRHGFDLMLAGHTHGGQIRVPYVGALLCPSLHGVKYACGVFHEAPTVLHVSRGLSGLDPVRFFCAPELVRLVLRSPAVKQLSAATPAAAVEQQGVVGQAT